MDSQWLITQFELHPEKSKTALAETLGLEPPAVSKILGGKRQIKAHEYIGMRRFFGLPSDGESSLQPKISNDTEIKDLTGLKENSGDIPESEWVIPSDLLKERTDASPDNIKIFKILENTMEPEFKLGENVVVDISDQSPSPPGTFIISDGYGHLIRQCELVTGSKPSRVRISGLKDGFQTQFLKLSEFETIGRVIARLQWL